MSNTKTEAQRLADGLLAETSKFGTPSIQRGLVNGAIQELRRLDAVEQRHNEMMANPCPEWDNKAYMQAIANLRERNAAMGNAQEIALDTATEHALRADELRDRLATAEAERDQLRAQVERLRGGEAVGEVFTMEVLCTPGRPFCHVQLNRILPTGTKLYTAQPAAPALVTWQPIETAPKDGTELIGWRDDCGVILIRWTSCDAFMSEREIESSGMDEETLFQQDWFCADFIAGCRLDGSETPTHWMPLPPAPVGIGKDGGEGKV